MTDFKPYYGKEKDFQVCVARYLDALGLLWFHPANGGSRNVREAVNLKKQGVKPGVPDVCIMEPRNGYHGMFIELKSEKGRSSPFQVVWIANLNDRNYKVIKSNSLDEVIFEIEQYLK